MSPPCLTNSVTEQNISLIILVNNGCCEVKYSVIIAHVKFRMRILGVGMEQKLSSCSIFFSVPFIIFFTIVYICLNLTDRILTSLSMQYVFYFVDFNEKALLRVYRHLHWLNKTFSTQMLRLIHSCICKKNSNRTEINCTTAIRTSLISITSLTFCSILSKLSLHACRTISIPTAIMIVTIRQLYGTCDDGKMNAKWTNRRPKLGQLLKHVTHLPFLPFANADSIKLNICRFNRCVDTYRFYRHRRFQWQQPWFHQTKTSSGEDRVARCFRNCWSRTVHFRDSYYIITTYQLVNEMACSIGIYYLRNIYKNILSCHHDLLMMKLKFKIFIFYICLSIQIWSLNY